MEANKKENLLSYYEEYVREWEMAEKGIMADFVDVIRQRNNYVLSVADSIPNIEKVLDIGCGTGYLVCELAKKQIKSIGIDMTKEMIDFASSKALELGCIMAEFIQVSAFEYNYQPSTFDLISACGFVDILNFEQLIKLFELSFFALKDGGSFVLSSRNRLFNLFSLNQYTTDEINAGNANSLLTEAVIIASETKIENLIGMKTASMPDYERLSRQEDVRYQYTPVQMINMLHNAGFKPIELYPIHIHGAVPKFKDNYTAEHVQISNTLQNLAKGNMYLLPFASSFMIHVKKSAGN
jgi:ubiquinone/menaquinone biosynthesis C-methylase UbiE